MSTGKSRALIGIGILLLAACSSPVVPPPAAPAQPTVPQGDGPYSGGAPGEDAQGDVQIFRQPYEVRDNHVRHYAGQESWRRVPNTGASEAPTESVRSIELPPLPSEDATVQAPAAPQAKTDAPRAAAAPRVDTTNVPTATRSRPGRVKLPFPPYNELDVADMPSGSLAKDPATGRIFRLP